MCVWFMIYNYYVVVVRSNDSFNFPLGLIKYIVICLSVYLSIYLSVYLPSGTELDYIPLPGGLIAELTEPREGGQIDCCTRFRSKSMNTTLTTQPDSLVHTL